MAVRGPLKRAGYWRPNDDWDDWRTESELPDPRWLVRRGWRRRERSKVLAYLRAGRIYAVYAGYSYCRFWLCWTRPPQMGSCDLTDGEWVWPQGLAHYVERHWVCLPDEFIEAMQSNDWRPPAEDAFPVLDPGESSYDLSFWVSWAKRQQKRPWYLIW